MSEGFHPSVVMEYERETWTRCGDNLANTFAGITGETVPLLLKAAGVRPGSRSMPISRDNIQAGGCRTTSF